MATQRVLHITVLDKNKIDRLTFTFTQEWLCAHGERLNDITLIKSLRNDFARFFYRWLQTSFPKTIHNYTHWENENFSFAAKDYLEDYDRFQKWTSFMSKFDNSQELGLFIAGKSVTFEKCLYVISCANGVFSKPLMQIDGYFMHPDSLVQWNIIPGDFIPLEVVY